jgi:branched-chain amino acid transport system permease protein
MRSALIESLTQALVPQAASFIVFAFMCVVLLLRPQGLFGISVVRSHEFLAARLPWIEPADKETAARRLTGMVPALAAVAALLALPMLLYPVYLMKIFCFTIFAASFNFLLGFAGIMSFGQAALFGTAAYLTAHAAREWALPPEAAIGVGIAAALVLGMVMGIFAIRRRGIYQAMITLAIAQMVYFVYVQASF